MKMEELITNVEVVNEEELFIIDRHQLDKLKYIDEIEGVKIGGPDIKSSLERMIEFLRNHKDFTLAMYRYNIGQTKCIWMFCLLYKIAGNLQRVQIENYVCANCGWKGIIANPTIPSLYDTVRDRKEALNLAWKLPVKGCPSCGKKSDRHSVWNE